ncbi:MAG: hypothetical protein KAJ24_02975, partial [Candidatus Aenigmarchaeota archaeon]|nr:hypothetical protein [Candidatus Aenigmarchaeota archaeon]
GRRVVLRTPLQMSLKYEDIGHEYSVGQMESYAPDSMSESELAYGWRAGQWSVFETPEGKNRIGNRIDVYDRDHIEERFDVLKEGLGNTTGLVSFSVQSIGDDVVAHNKTYEGALVLYRIDFRKYDVIATVSVLGAEGVVSIDDVVRYAWIVEEMIG